MAARLPSLLKVFRGEKKRRPGAAPAQEPEDPEQIQTLQDGAALEKTQEQEAGRSRLLKTLKMFGKLLRIRRPRKVGPTAAEGTARPASGLTELQAEPDVNPDWAERSADSEAAMKEDRAKADEAASEDVAVTNSNTAETEDISNTGSGPTLTGIHAPTKDLLEDSAAPSQEQVPAMVRNIHQTLLSHGTVDARLHSHIVRLAEEHPADVVLTLLRCAPTCDRAAARIWRSIGSSGVTVQKVLPTLLRVMEDWPLHSACASAGDDRDVFALAAALVTVQVPGLLKAMIPYSEQLFLALLFHIVITTQQPPAEEVDSFWGACQEEQRLPITLNRFAVQAMKVLLCRLRCEHVVMSMERKCAWETLLCADSQHYAMALLAREMRYDLSPLCSHVAYGLLLLLSSEKPSWDLPLLAFLVEVLECLHLRKCAGTVVKMMSSCLQMECRERRRLALRGLVVLSREPWMARRMCSLSESLLELLGEADGKVVSMSMHVLTNVLQADMLVSSSTAPKLAEALLLLFDHDNSYVQVLSLELFFRVMESVVEEGKKPLAKVLSQSLLPLFFQCHDEKRCVAKASRETLLGVAKFLKRRKLKQLVKKGQLSKFSEVLLAEDRSRAAEHLRGALRYLQSPQEPLREAAVRIIGMAGMVMRGRKEELQLLNEALQGLRRDDSPSQRNIALQQRIMERSAELRLSGGSEEPLLLKGLKTPWKRRSPGETRRDQERPAGASGTADDWHS